MVTHTCHTFAHVHLHAHVQKHTGICRGQVFGIASYTHTHTCTITQRQTGVLTVALHYSEPGVGGKGNKVVFISCSLGVL